MLKTIKAKRYARGSELKPRLPVTQRAAYGVGHVLNDLIANAWFSYSIIYLTKVVQLSSRYTGLVILFAQILDAIFTPFIGIICDKTVCRYGRRKVWHLIGSALVTVTIPLLFIKLLKNDTTDILKLAYYSGIFAVNQFGWGCAQISHLSLVPEITRQPSERMDLNAIRSAVRFLCGIYIYGASWILLGQSTEYKITPKVWKEFMYLSFIIAVSGNICNIAFHVFLKEPPSLAYLERLAKKQQKNSGSSLNKGVHHEGTMISKQDNNGFINHSLDTTSNEALQELNIQSLARPHCIGLAEESVTPSVTMDDTKDDCVTGISPNSCNDVINSRPNHSVMTIDRTSRHSKPTSKIQWMKSCGLYKTAAVYMCTRLVVNISQVYLPLYLTETLSFEKEAIAYLPLVVLISGVVASFLAKPLSKKLGQKITYMISGTTALCACVWFYFQTVNMRNGVYAATVLIGSGGSVMLVTSLSIIADLVGDDKKCGAFVYSVICFADKVVSGVVIAVIQELSPRDPHVDECSKCNDYIRIVQSIVPGAAAVLGLLTVVLFYNSKFIFCRIKVEFHDVGVQVDADKPWMDNDINDVRTSLDHDDQKCIAEVQYNYEKQMALETRF